MVNQSTEVGWTEAQWNQVQQAVSDEVNKASVAGSFLPCYGPLSQPAETVRNLKVRTTDDNLVEVDNDEILNIWTLAVRVCIRRQQLTEENLTSALFAFRRAASLLANEEDGIIFNGVSETAPTNRQVTLSPKGPTRDGLVLEGIELPPPEFPDGEVKRPYPKNLVKAVASAVTVLERNGHYGPFACVLGSSAFVDAHTPEGGSLVLPRDRMEPLLGMGLLRASTMPKNGAIVVSLAGGLIDLAVATAPTVQFLRINDEGQYIFRVFERFALRIKEDYAVSYFQLVEPNTSNAPGTPDTPQDAQDS